MKTLKRMGFGRVDDSIYRTIFTAPNQRVNELCSMLTAGIREQQKRATEYPIRDQIKGQIYCEVARDVFARNLKA